MVFSFFSLKMPVTLEEKKDPQRAFCLCGILNIDNYFIREKKTLLGKKEIQVKKFF